MSFPPLHIVDPQPDHSHTHTIILLHGRGSTANEFATDFFSHKTSESSQSLRDTNTETKELVTQLGLITEVKVSCMSELAALEELEPAMRILAYLEEVQKSPRT